MAVALEDYRDGICAICAKSVESVLGKEKDGANLEVHASRPVQIHDLSLNIKEKPSLFLDV